MLAFTAACNKDAEVTHSTPVIEQADVSPHTFTYGDSITLTAKISYAVYDLYTLKAQVVVGNMIVAEQTVYKWTKQQHGKSAEVSAKILVPFVKNMAHNAQAKVLLTLGNTALDVTEGEVAELTGNRPRFERLYLIASDDSTTELLPDAENPDIYKATGLSLRNSITYKIAQAITTDGDPDYAKFVWGLADGAIGIIDNANGGNITTAEPMLKSTQAISFDAFAFATTLTGEMLPQLATLSEVDFAASETIDDETFGVCDFYIENGTTITLGGDLASLGVVFTPAFFTRTVAQSVVFEGATGVYALYYNPVRKNVIVGVSDTKSDDYYLMEGTGIGYPAGVSEAVLQATYPGHILTTFEMWGFDNVLRYILFRKISANTYQGTVLLPGSAQGWGVYAGFKFHAATDWSGEIAVGDIMGGGGFSGTATDVIAEIQTNSTSTTNFEIQTPIPQACYQITINVATKSVQIDPVSIPGF
ncbi:hypothetical protein AGMMS4956_01390 [Bacteroidia bacterium]|nr:hypothetical protein AGMMS4956_01390 [Bacteroidia bacterium]